MAAGIGGGTWYTVEGLIAVPVKSGAVTGRAAVAGVLSTAAGGPNREAAAGVGAATAAAAGVGKMEVGLLGDENEGLAAAGTEDERSRTCIE